MNTEQEPQVQTMPEYNENVDPRAKLAAGIGAIVIAIIVVIFLIPGFRMTIIDWVTTSDAERAAQLLVELEAISQGETLSDEESARLFADVGEGTLTPEEAALLLQELER